MINTRVITVLIKTVYSYSEIEEIIKSKSALMKYQRRTVILKTALNGSGLFNIITVSVLFAGPLIINAASVISCVCPLVAQLVNELNHMILLESVILVVSTFVTLHSCYSIFVDILENYAIQLLKTEQFFKIHILSLLFD